MRWQHEDGYDWAAEAEARAEAKAVSDEAKQDHADEYALREPAW